MLANRSTDTGPEKAVRGMLREAGHPGYRLHWRIDDGDGRYVCRPDITYPGRKLAIFVHGCFWQVPEVRARAAEIEYRLLV
jgi:DNA mismatch endonuclease (patch repair protein)